MKNIQDLKISADFADLLCTTDPRNWGKVEKSLYNYQVKS